MLQDDWIMAEFSLKMKSEFFTEENTESYFKTVDRAVEVQGWPKLRIGIWSSTKCSEWRNYKWKSKKNSEDTSQKGHVGQDVDDTRRRDICKLRKLYFNLWRITKKAAIYSIQIDFSEHI